jgi:hypothetical protein
VQGMLQGYQKLFLYAWFITLLPWEVSWKPPRNLVTGDAEHPKLDHKNISNFDERDLTMAKLLIELHPHIKKL